jgi:hypothetical protein
MARNKEAKRENTRTKGPKSRYGLSIVRLVKNPQTELSDCMEQVSEFLGVAFEPDKGEKGVVLLESRAILGAIKDRRGSVDKRMLCEAEQHLNGEMKINNISQEPIEVRVNRRRPLGMYGRHRDVLAINLAMDIRLGADRGAVEMYVDKFYPNQKDLKQRAKAFEPHITIGKIKPQFLEDVTLDEMVEDAAIAISMPPLSASPMDKLIARAHGGLVIPDVIALNGLRIAVETH